MKKINLKKGEWQSAITKNVTVKEKNYIDKKNWKRN